MSEQNAEVTETGTEAQQQTQELPSDHPLVKTLAAQKADIKRLKAEAAELAELKEAQKTEAEKFAERLAKAESESASVPAKVAEGLRAHLVALHGIDAEDAELFLTATDPEVLLKQIDRLVGQSGKRKKNHVPREGNNPQVTDNDPRRQFLREVMGRQ